MGVKGKKNNRVYLWLHKIAVDSAGNLEQCRKNLAKISQQSIVLWQAFPSKNSKPELAALPTGTLGSTTRGTSSYDATEASFL